MGAVGDRGAPGAQVAVQDALKGLYPHIDRAGQTLLELQRFSVRRAVWQHAVVAAVAILVTLLSVWWYVPPASGIAALRAQRDELRASIDKLPDKGGRITVSMCG